MIRTALQRRAGRALHRIQSHPYSLPRRRLISTSRPVSLWPWTSYRRWQSTAIVSSGEVDPSAPQLPVAAAIEACPGCGAPAQTVEPGDAGYYLNKRKAVRSFVLAKARDSSFKPGDESPRDALEGLDDRHASTAARAATASSGDDLQTPLCDRCHDLLHHRSGLPIAHPSMASLQDTIAESPYKHNHIYHVIDAADFPMSLISNIHKELEASLQRTRNRRAKHAGFKHGKKTEISFIITRSDLLAPKKEQVDRLMNYMVQVLRNALGSYAEGVRLGNVRCVSSKRGWWTRDIKQDIWNRGGGGWLVGKVNVGKSNLYEVVFPKGRAEDINIQALRSKVECTVRPLPPTESEEDSPGELLDPSANDLDNLLLPPARPETPFPSMPTVSALPGTTASPIRIPFGNGKGELIDLPGLSRASLDHSVQPEHHDLLVMKWRVTPEQYSVKSGRSLLLADIIRITPLDPDVVLLAYPFVPLKPHVTSNDKAVEIQAGNRGEGTQLQMILNESGRKSVKSAGTYRLSHDVTKARAGPLTTKSGVGLKPKELPFVVLSTDILVEGVGWVELVAQVRRRRPSSMSTATGGFDENMKWQGGRQTRPKKEAQVDEPDHFPEVEVFSPEGKFVGSREPMGAWLLGAKETLPGRKSGGRPRKAMAGVKKRDKSG